MEIIETPEHMRLWSRNIKSADSGASVGFVPTMGALHAGHFSLVNESQRQNKATVVSIFVNPTQFNSSSDFDSYPRTLSDDLEKCRAAGVDAVFVPDVEAMYPEGATTTIDPGPIAHSMEGKHRPGHFAGVATIVVKLIHSVEPTVAYFGEKDFQQVAVIRRVVSDLDLDVRVSSMPTIRDHDGVALSSRNTRLSEAERIAARSIGRGLGKASQLCARGERDATVLRAVIEQEILLEPLCRLEYIEIVDPITLKQVSHIDDIAVACIATWCGEVRLIDNIALRHS